VRAKAGFQQLEFPIGKVLYQNTGGIGSPRISPTGNLIAFLKFPLGAMALAPLSGGLEGQREDPD
jgi:hypothetical protein